LVIILLALAVGCAPSTSEAISCKNGGAVTAGANDPLAARVNGVGIPASLYQRQVTLAQAALVDLDPNSAKGQETLTGLRQQILNQMIDNALTEQAAARESVTVSDADVTARVRQGVQDAGGLDKFNAYLQKNQLTVDDLCIQIRATLYSDAMIERVTAALPTKVAQVHARHIVLASADEAQKVLAQLQGGGDFAALAKQFSQDTATKDNSGDLGWFPKGVLPPELEAVAFQLQPGQVSGAVQTQLGFHILQVLERDSARDLPPELLQNQRQQAFLAWLEAQRANAKIERLVNP
jgi:parvulin-like peptidyl-prolyl isomerase